MYIASYYTHFICVLLSGSFFLVRGYWMLTDNPLLQIKPVRILPHVIDSLLLLAAIALMLQTSQYPFAEAWLTVKLVLLLAYIGLGVFALRRGKTKAQRTVFLVAALGTFAFMYSVAITRSPLGVLAMF